MPEADRPLDALNRLAAKARRWLDRLGHSPSPATELSWVAVEIEVLRREAERLIRGRR